MLNKRETSPYWDVFDAVIKCDLFLNLITCTVEVQGVMHLNIGAISPIKYSRDPGYAITGVPPCMSLCIYLTCTPISPAKSA